MRATRHTSLWIILCKFFSFQMKTLSHTHTYKLTSLSMMIDQPKLTECLTFLLLLILSLCICDFIFYFDYSYDYCSCILNKSENISFFFLFLLQTTVTAAPLKVVNVEKSKFGMSLYVNLNFFSSLLPSCLYNKYKSSVLSLHSSLNRS